MITVGFDFGTHQTKICYENVEAGTMFYEVFRFRGIDGREELTCPSFIRLSDDGTLRYGHEAVDSRLGGQAITYFKQKMFSWTSGGESLFQAESWSVLYLAYLIFKLDAHLKTPGYVVQMGMPTDADPQHYTYCKHQAIKVMASAMQLAREAFRGDFEEFLRTPYTQLEGVVAQCLASIPSEIRDARKKYPVLVFPEAYVSLIPLIDDHRLPTIGPDLFVDIGGGTVDISFFTNQMDASTGRDRPFLYYYHSIPYGLNMITGQDLDKSHDVQVGKEQITAECGDRLLGKIKSAVDEMMAILRRKYEDMCLTKVMPFADLCAQVLESRPVCYSGGGSMFGNLKLPVKSVRYGFSQITTVSELIDHSKLYVGDEMFHVLATAFALSHRSLNDMNASVKSGVEPDSICLVSIDKLFSGIRLPTAALESELSKCVTRYGTVELIKHDYTLDLERAKAGDLEAQKRIERMRETGNVPIGITIAEDLGKEGMKALMARQEEERKRNEEIKQIRDANSVKEANKAFLRESERKRDAHESKISLAKASYDAGDIRAAVQVASLLLEHPNFSEVIFEQARDWLNIAKDRDIIDVGLLRQFADVCRSGRINHAQEHLKRYMCLIKMYEPYDLSVPHSGIPGELL